MKIDYLELKNFRQYVDQTINFAHPEKEKNFTIILGANGAGKTNLLNAITWCLYGEELHNSTRALYEGLPLVNTTTFRELNPGESCDASVSLQFRDQSGQRAHIIRTLRFRKTNDGKMQPIPGVQSNYPDGSSVVMTRQVGRDWISVTEPKCIINRLFPKYLEKYFFFNGERAFDQYFRETAGETIRQTVFERSQSGHIENVIKHSRNNRDDNLRQMKKSSPKASALIEDIRKDIEEKTKKQFFDIIWKKDAYSDVKIDDNYNIAVVHQSDSWECTGTLPADEKQLLGLSFMAALNSVSGFNGPIIIDTLLGRMSREHGKSISSNLSNYLKEKQVTLLMTEEEYTPEVKESLSERVGKSYIIKCKETGNSVLAEVVPYVE